jgi:two-component system cell cycle sensor histidine kinase/response regulator CckA
MSPGKRHNSSDKRKELDKGTSGFGTDVQIRTLSALSSLLCSSASHAKSHPSTFTETIRRECGIRFVSIVQTSDDHQQVKILESAGVRRRNWQSLVRDLLDAKRLRGSGVMSYNTAGAGPSSVVLRRMGLRGLAVAPIRSRGKIEGALLVGTRTLLDDRTSNLRFLTRLSGFAGLWLKRQRWEENVLNAEQGSAAIMRGILEGIIVFDVRGRTIVDANRRASELTGYGRRTLLGRRFDQVVSKRIGKKTVAQFVAHAPTGGMGTFVPAEIIRRDGKNIPIEIAASWIPTAESRLVVAVCRDLSEQKRAEVKLAASEDLLRIIVDGTLDMFFYVHNTRGVFTYVSPSVEKLTGHPPEAWKFHYTKFLTENPINKQVREYTNRSIRQGVLSPAYLCEVRHADGRPILLEINEKPILREGRVIGIQGVARDITEKKRLEEAILESRDSLDRILDQTPMAVMVFDDRGNLIDVNGAWLRLFGATEKPHVVGRLNLFHSPFFKKAGMLEEMSKVFRGKIVDVPALKIDPGTARPEINLTGVERSVHMRMFPVIHRNGKLANAVAMFEDVTERRRLEEQLIQSQKMESIGLLAGGIAHDFNNILGGILGYSSFVRAQVPKTEKIYDHLETIERSALRAAELTSQLLAFARGGKYVVGPILLNDLVKETTDLLGGSIGKHITLETRLDPDAPVIEADSSQIQQVLMNLCVNARDAMPLGGKLTLTTTRLKSSDAYLSSLPEALPMQYVRVDIEDTGVGIDKSILGRIFDPFFTTKEKGKGTGLGLAMVYGIVKNHGGFVNVESAVGVGTKFSVYLPSVSKSAEIATVPEVRTTGGKETILFVDDEETIRSLVKDILEEKGYHVLAAADGGQAVEMFRNNPDGIDLVILDMTMPVMGGRETFIRLKEIKPSVRAILSTGYSEDDHAREVLALGVKAFVQKPYRVDDLAASVRKTLDASTSDSEKS